MLDQTKETCRECGRVFTLKNINQKFCSTECQYENFKKRMREKRKLNSEFMKQEKARRLAIKNSVRGNECESCGSKESLQNHHPDYDQPLNTITLCASCHAHAHRNLILEKERKSFESFNHLAQGKYPKDWRSSHATI